VLTIAEVNQEGVTVTRTDPKQCSTVLATISASGQKLPMWALCSGSTAQCDGTHVRKASPKNVNADEIKKAWKALGL
jgi:hypothetical protein